MPNSRLIGENVFIGLRDKIVESYRVRARAPSTQMGRTGRDQCVALGEVGKGDALYRRGGMQSYRTSAFGQRACKLWAGLTSNWCLRHARVLEMSSQTGSEFRSSQCPKNVWGGLENIPRKLHLAGKHANSSGQIRYEIGNRWRLQTRSCQKELRSRAQAPIIHCSAPVSTSGG